MGTNVAFLGLGVMGYPMAGHLANGDHCVTVYNRTAEKAAGWLAEHGEAGEGGHSTGATPREAAAGAEIVFACVGADDDLRQICLGDDGAFGGMEAGAIFVDHTTTSAKVAREMAKATAAKGLHFLDAPVSGGEAGAQKGQLTVMMGGDADQFAKVKPAIRCFAKMVKLIGPVGAGQTTKMVNQICIAGTVQGLAEAIHFAIESGLDTEKVLDVISQGAAGSWQMEHRWPTMVEGEFNFGFAVDWMRKDLGFVLEEAKRLGISVPVTALVDQFYADVQRMGGNRQDTSSLIRRFRG